MLPTKVNLFILGIILHLLLSCNIFSHLWIVEGNWLGFSSVHPFKISDHFIQFGNSTGISKKMSLLNVFNLIHLRFGALE
jgi:hypothetical protein